MSVTITWQIDDMKRNTETGGVFEVFWTVWATRQEKYVTGINGSVELSPDPDSDTFIAYDDLTQDNVISWVHNILDRDIIEQEVTDKLNRLHPLVESIPVESTGIPWASS
jgi:hypothetical protein